MNIIIWAGVSALVFVLSVAILMGIHSTHWLRYDKDVKDDIEDGFEI